MKNKITSIIIATIAVVVGYVVSNPLIFQICGNFYKFNDRVGCIDSSINSIGSPLLIFSSYLFVIVLVTAFFSEKIFTSWLKLAVWMIPLLLMLVATQPVNVTHILSTNRDDAARLAGQVFSVISLILIIWKYFVARRFFSKKA